VEKKTLFTTAFISLLLFSAATGTQSVNLAKANPVAFIEDSTPFSISIVSPKNNETFSENNIQLNFTVTRPPAGLYYIWKGTLHSISYQLDGVFHEPIVVNHTFGYPELSTSYSVNLTNVENGIHILSVNVSGTSLGGDLAHGTFLHDVPINGSSEVVYFRVDAETPVSPLTIVTVTSGASITAVGVGLLVYCRKRNKKSGGES